MCVCECNCIYLNLYACMCWCVYVPVFVCFISLHRLNFNWTFPDNLQLMVDGYSICSCRLTFELFCRPWVLLRWLVLLPLLLLLLLSFIFPSLTSRAMAKPVVLYCIVDNMIMIFGTVIHNAVSGCVFFLWAKDTLSSGEKDFKMQ